MLRLASALGTILVVIPSALAFSATIRPKITARIFPHTALCYHPPAFDRAVDCVNSFGMCDIDELVELSEELERFQGCFYETDPEACLREINDRKDLADLLLLQGEIRERNHYTKEGSLFAHDVQAGRDMEGRDDFFEQIAPSLDV